MHDCVTGKAAAHYKPDVREQFSKAAPPESCWDLLNPPRTHNYVLPPVEDFVHGLSHRLKEILHELIGVPADVYCCLHEHTPQLVCLEANLSMLRWEIHQQMNHMEDILKHCFRAKGSQLVVIELVEVLIPGVCIIIAVLVAQICITCSTSVTSMSKRKKDHKQ